MKRSFPKMIYKMILRTRDSKGVFQKPLIIIQEIPIERETKAAYITTSGGLYRKRLQEHIAKRMTAPNSLWTTERQNIDKLCSDLLHERLRKLEVHFKERINEINILKGAISRNDYKKQIF